MPFNKLRLGVDTGGTFTDAVIMDEESGEFIIDKVSSTPSDPSLSFYQIVAQALETTHAKADHVSYLVHGTTVATNCIIESKTAKCGFLTTKGFRDILEIARQIKPEPFNIHFEKPKPLVPRQLCLEVEERLAATGEWTEPLGESARSVYLFGAGHVGLALATILAMLPMRVTLLDPRPELLLDTPIGVRAMSAADPAGEVASLPHGSFVLVMTHDHQLDFEIVAAALARPDFNGVGLIGSQTKRARFVHRLRRLGLSADCIARLLCPIGIPGVGGKLPAEIAVAVAAQLLTLCRDIPNPHPAAADCHDCARPCLEVPA